MDKNTFQNLFETYYNPLCNFAMRYTQDTKAAEDIVQDVFVKFWMKRAVVDADKNVKSFLFQSTKNRAIEILRRNKLEKAYKDSQERNLEVEEDLDKVSDDLMLKERINSSIRQLPPKCQEVFTLGKMNGLTYREIANELEISIKTVENQMGRALRILRQKLSK